MTRGGVGERLAPTNDFIINTASLLRNDTPLREGNIVERCHHGTSGKLEIEQARMSVPLLFTRPIYDSRISLLVCHYGGTNEEEIHLPTTKEN